MEKTREEVLSKMYLGRAILSKLSETSSIIEAKKQLLKKPILEKNNIDNNTFRASYSEYIKKHEKDEIILEYENNMSFLLTTEEEHKNKYQKYSDDLNQLRKQRVQIEKYVKSEKKIIITLDVILSILTTFFGILKLYVFSCIFIFIGIMLNVSYFIINRSKNKKRTDDILQLEEKEKKLTREVSTFISNDKLENNDEYKKKKLRNGEIELYIRKTVLDEILQRRENVYQKKMNLYESAENEINISMQLWNVLNEKMKNILDERDWTHLDTLIYLLESGRADTLKEALQQTDLLLRHNEITGLMQKATIAICSTIKNSFDSLSSSISNQFTRLNSQVAELNKTSGGLSEKISDLVSVQELNNALLKKANVSSEQLADDVSRLRLLKDYEYYGIK